VFALPELLRRGCSSHRVHRLHAPLVSSHRGAVPTCCGSLVFVGPSRWSPARHARRFWSRVALLGASRAAHARAVTALRIPTSTTTARPARSPRSCASRWRRGWRFWVPVKRKGGALALEVLAIAAVADPGPSCGFASTGNHRASTVAASCVAAIAVGDGPIIAAAVPPDRVPVSHSPRGARSPHSASSGYGVYSTTGRRHRVDQRGRAAGRSVVPRQTW